MATAGEAMGPDAPGTGLERHGRALGRSPDGRLVWASLGLLTLMFLPTLSEYPTVWRAQPYTHGYLIALGSAWLVWRQRHGVRRGAIGWRAPLLPAALLSIAWLAATVAGIRVVSLSAMPALLLLWAAAVLGADALRRLAPAAAIFFLAVPLWGVLTLPLQAMTVGVTSASMGLFRVPAAIEGSVVEIPSGSFLIADGCAGLSYLLSGLTIAALYTQIVPMRPRAQVATLGTAALLAIVGNWIRVATLVAIGHASSMQSIFIQEPLPHLFYGWAIFCAGLLVFFPLAGAIVRRHPRADAAHVTAREIGGAPTPGPGIARRPVLAATTVVLVGPVMFYAIGALPRRDVPLLVLEPDPASWTSVAGQRPYAWQPAFEGAEERLVSGWTDGAARVIVDRLVYRHQAQGAELVGYTSRIAPEGGVLVERLFGLVGRERRLVIEAVVHEGEGAVLVWYWYRVGGVETASPTRAKLLEVWAFLRRATVSELIAVSAPCGPAECSQASALLTAFIDAT